MHKPTIRKVRKHVLILAAAALILAPSLNLPTAKAQATDVSGAAEKSSTTSIGISASPQAPSTGEPTLPASGEEAADVNSSASTPPVLSTSEEPAAEAPTGDTVSDPETSVDPAAASTQPAAKPVTKPVTTPATKPAATPNTPTTPAAKPVPAAPEAPAPFYDIVNDPNRDAIMTLFNEQIVKPAKDRKFRPKAEIGRADFTVILGRAMDANGSIFDVYFKDPIPDWAIRYVGGLSAAGIYEGYLDGDTFGPKQPVTRAEAAAMVARAAHLESQPLPEGLGGVGNVPIWALDDIGAAYAAGLITVTETGTLNPNKKVTRSEMAAMIAPLLETKAFLTPFEVEEDITLP